MVAKPGAATAPWLGVTAVAVLLLGVAGMVTISAGLFDPTPAHFHGPVLALQSQSLAPGEISLRWLAGIPGGDQAIVRLQLTGPGSDAELAYGLVVGDAGRYLALATNPQGYAAAWLRENGGATPLVPWQPWPHVHPGQAPNELQIARQGDTISLWVNRERLWQGEVAGLGSNAGTYAQSFGPAGQVNFQRLEMGP